MNFRNATIQDLPVISTIENECFPVNEAASLQSFAKRLQVFPRHFWLLEIEGQVVGYVNGMVTDNATIQDAMFEEATLHYEKGAWQSVFGLAVLPAFRNRGYAAKLINHLIEKSKEQNRVGITLTCKKHLVEYYSRLGFTDRGISQSAHGGAVWHDMTLHLK